MEDDQRRPRARHAGGAGDLLHLAAPLQRSRDPPTPRRLPHSQRTRAGLDAEYVDTEGDNGGAPSPRPRPRPRAPRRRRRPTRSARHVSASPDPQPRWRAARARRVAGGGRADRCRRRGRWTPVGGRRCPITARSTVRTPTRPSPAGVAAVAVPGAGAVPTTALRSRRRPTPLRTPAARPRCRPARRCAAACCHLPSGAAGRTWSFPSAWSWSSRWCGPCCGRRPRTTARSRRLPPLPLRPRPMPAGCRRASPRRGGRPAARPRAGRRRSRGRHGRRRRGHRSRRPHRRGPLELHRDIRCARWAPASRTAKRPGPGAVPQRRGAARLTSLHPDTGTRDRQRAPTSMRVPASSTAGRWSRRRADLPRGVPVGPGAHRRVRRRAHAPAVGRQPRPNCESTGFAATSGRLAVLQRCPDEPADRLTVLIPDGAEADKPQEEFSVPEASGTVSNATLVAVSDDRGRRAARPSAAGGARPLGHPGGPPSASTSPPRTWLGRLPTAWRP